MANQNYYFRLRKLKNRLISKKFLLVDKVDLENPNLKINDHVLEVELGEITDDMLKTDEDSDDSSLYPTRRGELKYGDFVTVRGTFTNSRGPGTLRAH